MKSTFSGMIVFAAVLGGSIGTTYKGAANAKDAVRQGVVPIEAFRALAGIFRFIRSMGTALAQ